MILSCITYSHDGKGIAQYVGQYSTVQPYRNGAKDLRSAVMLLRIIQFYLRRMQSPPALHFISKSFLHLVPRRYCTPYPGISVHNVSGNPFTLFSHATHGVAWQRRLTIHHKFLNSVGLHVDTTIIVRACRHCHEGIAPILPPTPGWTFQTDIFDRSSPQLGARSYLSKTNDTSHLPLQYNTKSPVP